MFLFMFKLQKFVELFQLKKDYNHKFSVRHYCSRIGFCRSSPLVANDMEMVSKSHRRGLLHGVPATISHFSVCSAIEVWPF